MRPFSRSRPRREQLVVDPLLAGEVDLHQLAPALLGHLGERAVAGDAGVVDDDVDAVGEALGDLRRRVGVGDVELDRLAAERARGHALSVLGERRARRAPTTSAPSRASVVRDRLADPARGAGDERDLAGERAAPSRARARWRPPGRSGPPGRRRRPSAARAGSAASSRSASSAPGGDVARAGRSRRAPTSLPSERVKPSSARWAVALARRAGLGGRRAEHDRPARSAPAAATSGWKKRCSSTSSVESAIPVASKRSALRRGSRVVRALRPRSRRAGRSSCLAEPPARRRPEQHRAGDRPARRAGGARSCDRLRQPEPRRRSRRRRAS